MCEVHQPQMVSSLTITRTSPDDLKQREVIAVLDGEEIARLMDGDSVTKEIAPGRHRLRVDNTWNRKTVEFDATPGDHPKFFVTNRAGSLSQFFNHIWRRSYFHRDSALTLRQNQVMQLVSQF